MRLNGIEFDSSRISAMCPAAGVKRLWVFGSVLTSRFTSTSDIDILVETDPLSPRGLFALGGFQMELSELLGRNVHLSMLGGVPPHERDSVLASARLLDAA